MSSHAKAAPAGSIRTGKRHIGSLLAILALALCVIGSSAPAAFAAPTVLTVESVSEVGYGSARVKGKINADGFAYSTIEISSDGGATWSGFTYERVFNDNADHTVERTFTGLKAATTYEVRLAAGTGGGEFFSAEPNLEFTTLASDPPTVLAVDDPADVFSTTAKVSGEVERPADPDPLLDAHPAVDVQCNFEFVTEEQFNATGFDGAGVAGCDPPNPVEAEGASDVTATLSGLTPSTTYHLRLSGKNAGGSDSKVAANTFTTEAKVPAPTVLTVDDASEVSYNTAKLTGEVERPAGEDPELNTSCRFEYITDAQFDQNLANSAPGFEGASAAYCPDMITDSGSTDLEMSVSGLTHGTEYHQRLVVENGGGSDAEEGPTFTTKLVTPPVVETDDATLVTGTTAHFSGEVTAGNSDVAFDTDCFFDYVPDKEFQVGRSEEQSLTVSIEPGSSGENPNYKLLFEGEETAAIPYDAPAAQVEGALQALSSIGVGGVAVTGGPGSLKGDTPYFIAFSGPKNVPELGVDASGLHDNGLAIIKTTVEGAGAGFEGGGSIPCEPSTVTGADGVKVKADPTGLDPHTVYHLRLRAKNQGGESIDTASNFETETIAPLIDLVSVADVTATSATLRAQINPGGAATTYHFEYLTLQAFEEAGESFAGAIKTPESSSIGSDFTYHTATASIGGLQEDTPYRFRVVAKNEKSQPGGTAGPVRRFRTALTPVPTSDTCPNAAVRGQQGSQYLPECRAYEIVNSPSLELGEVHRVTRITDDGEAAAYLTLLPDAEAHAAPIVSSYVARRTSSGWTQASADATPLRAVALATAVVAAKTFSPDLSRNLVESTVSFAPEDDDSGRSDIYAIDVGSGTATLMTPDTPETVNQVIGASPNLDRIVIYSGFLTNGSMTQPGIWATDGESYEFLGGTPAGGGARRGLGTSADNSYNSRVTSNWVERGGDHGVSDDARRVYVYKFGPGSPLLLSDATDGTAETIPVSESDRAGEEGDLAGALFISATHDGSSAYFVSEAALTDDSGPGGAIYRFDLASRSVTQLVPNPGSLAGAIASDDQSHLYFTATGALAPGAVAGQNNAYVWTEAGGIRFIADVGPLQLNNLQPRPVTPVGIFSRVSRDGRYALMMARGSIDGAPNNGQIALYEYDYVEDTMTCVSCRPDGSPSQGDATLETQSFGFPPGAGEVHARAITDNGRVFFNSTDRLTEADETFSQDVYVYDKGKLGLISSGDTKEDSYLVENSDDGRHVFFTTRAKLVGADRDAAEFDAYDAVVNGGFLEPPPPPAPCEGEGCRGSVSTPPSGLGAASGTLVGAGDPKPRPKCRKGKVRRHGKCVKKHPKHRKQAKRNGRTGR